MPEKETTRLRGSFTGWIEHRVASYKLYVQETKNAGNMASGYVQDSIHKAYFPWPSNEQAYCIRVPVEDLSANEFCYFVQKNTKKPFAKCSVFGTGSHVYVPVSAVIAMINNKYRSIKMNTKWDEINEFGYDVRDVLKKQKEPTQEADWQKAFSAFSKWKASAKIVAAYRSVPILTENYRPYWLFCGKTSNGLDYLKWALLEAQVSTMPKAGGKPNRYKNEKCNLVLVPGPHIDSLKTQLTDNSTDILDDLLKEVRKDASILSQAKLVSRNEVNGNIAEYMNTDPFGIYETWMLRADFDKYCQRYETRPLPRYASNKVKRDKVIADIKEREKSFTPRAKKNIENAYYNNTNAHIHEDESVLINPLSWDKIEKAEGKARVITQGDLLGSASEIATGPLGWPKPPVQQGRRENVMDDGLYVAEWLHLAAFSWGGIWGESGNHISSQIPANLVLGSSETNSVMTRYEKAWQRLFKYETAFRRANNDNTIVTGELMINKNIDLDVRDPHKAPSTYIKFNDDADLKAMYEALHWMAFAIHYQIDLDCHSYILRRNKPQCVVQFWPFTRFCFTRLENELDGKILSRLKDTAKIDKFAASMQIEDEDSKDIALESHPAGRMATMAPTHLLPEPSFDGENGAKISSSSDIVVENQFNGLGERVAQKETRQQEIPSVEVTQTTGNTREEDLIDDRIEPAALGQQEPSAPAANGFSGREINFAPWIPSPAIYLDDEKSILLGAMPVTNLQVQILQLDGTIALQETRVVPHPTTAVDMKPFMFEPKTERALEDPFSIFVPVPTTESFAPSSVAALQDDSTPAMTTSSIVPSQQKVDMFIVEADCQLFGLIPAKIKSRQGPLLDQETIRETVVPIQSSISLGTVIPSLKGSMFDVVTANNPIFTYAERTLDLAVPAGFRLSADLIFQNDLAPVGDALKSLFNMTTPGMHMDAYLGPFVDWQHALQDSSVVFRGSFEAMALALGDVMTVRRLGVELSCVKSAAPNGALQWMFGYGFFGTVDISIVPMTLDLYMTWMNGMYVLRASTKDSVWKDVFGIGGVNLEQVSFTTQVRPSTGWKDLVFEMQAALTLGDRDIAFIGMYSKEETFLETIVQGFTMVDVFNLYTQITGKELEPFTHDVYIDTLRLRISTAGFILEGIIEIDGHVAAMGRIAISGEGLEISGAVEDITLESFDDMVIKKASFNVLIGRRQEKTLTRTSQFAITGEVMVKELAFKMMLLLEQAADSETRWTIYGEVSGDFSLKSLVSIADDSPLNLSLKHLAIVATNYDGNTGGTYNPYGYPIRKGVQLCAELDSIAALDAVMRGQIRGLQLAAGYSAGSFSLAIALPKTSSTFHLGPDVTAGPFALAITVGNTPQLEFRGDLTVHLSSQPEKLTFHFALDADIKGASASGNMDGIWKNPLSVGKDVAVSEVGLKLGILYAQFATTGTPSEFGISGRLAIGSKVVAVICLVSSGSSSQLLRAGVKDLGLSDVVKFVSSISGVSLPCPSDDFLRMEDVLLLVSTGADWAGIHYDAGAWFDGTMIVLGKKVQVKASVGSTIAFKASIEAFKAGPLSVKGVQKDNPEVDLLISSSEQRFHVEGQIELFALTCSANITVAVLPAPKFDFDFMLKFSDLLLIRVRAALTGSFDYKSLGSLDGADFELYALFEQHIVDYILHQIDALIESAKTAARQGKDKFKDDLSRLSAAYDAAVTRVSVEVAAAEKQWIKKSEEVNQKFSDAKAELEKAIPELQEKVEVAHQNFKTAVYQAKQALTNAELAQSAAIKEAQAKVAKAEEDGQRDIDSAQRTLDDLQGQFNAAYGMMDEKIRNAQSEVDSLQAQIDSYDREIDGLENEIKSNFPLNPENAVLGAQIAGLTVAKLAVVSSKAVASGVLSTAQDYVHLNEYIVADRGIKVARSAVEAARTAKTGLLAAANEALGATNDLQRGLVEAARQGLATVETASEELHLWDAAKEILRVTGASLIAAMSTAQTAVNGLSKCGEKVAFDGTLILLEEAKNNHGVVDLAKKIADDAEEAFEVVMDIARGILQFAGKILDIQKIELKGSLKGIAGSGGTPLSVHVEAIVLGRKTDFPTLEWKPGQTQELIKGMFDKLWEELKGTFSVKK